ncbi:MAG: hypothetical protein R3Y58_09135 [Eubacteriales bacterium]
MNTEVIQVACPCCRNKRLFDLLHGATGTIQIKCPICKQVIAIPLHTYHKKQILGTTEPRISMGSPIV